ncbi:hypothetical protein [Peribacillus asahii]
MAYFQKVLAKNKQGYNWKCTEEGPRNLTTGNERKLLGGLLPKKKLLKK